MSRGYKPQRASDRTDRSNLFSFTKDKILQRHVGPALLRKLNGGEKPTNVRMSVRGYVTPIRAVSRTSPSSRRYQRA